MGQSKAPGAELPSSSNNITATTTTHREHAPPAIEDPLGAKRWNTHDGDAALALFENSDELHEHVSYEDEQKVLRKIDFMILPYLAVCYAFFYIDKVCHPSLFPLCKCARVLIRYVGEKTTLSYAAIFGIRDDLHLVGTEYNWLSSLFYFGFLAWAFPTNFLLQRLPIGECHSLMFLSVL